MVTMSLTSCGDNGGSSSDASPSDSQSSASAPEGNNTTANPDGPIAIVVPAAEHGWMAGIAYFAEQKCKEMGLEEGTGYKLVTSATVSYTHLDCAFDNRLLRGCQTRQNQTVVDNAHQNGAN